MKNKDLTEKFNLSLARLGLPPCPEEALRRFALYASLLEEKNKVMNLTSVDDGEGIFLRHFADSLALLPFVGPGSAIDVGCGAGFPGLPLKIMADAAGFPLRLTLLDATEKKVAFLREVCGALELSDVDCVCGRAEELAAPDRPMREAFDFAVSRAVASSGMLAELCMPFVRPGGSFLFLKSEKAREEVETASSAFKILGGNEAELLPYTLGEGGFFAVRVKKERRTPHSYPRKFAKIKSSPL